jgi:hypothetical protein
MKTLIVCSLLLTVSLSSHAQSQEDDPKYRRAYDSLWRNKIVNLEFEQENIKLNLKKSHDQFKTGTIVSILGVLATGAGAVLNGNESGSGNALFIIGGAASMIGVGIQIDSHKFVGRAGKY